MLDFNLRINGYLFEKRIDIRTHETCRASHLPGDPPRIPTGARALRNAHNLAPFPAACQSQIAGILEARNGGTETSKGPL